MVGVERRRGSSSTTLLPPLLKQTLALTPAVGAPEVAATGAVVAAVVGAMVAVAAAPHTRSSVKVDQRRAPAKINSSLPDYALILEYEV